MDRGNASECARWRPFLKIQLRRHKGDRARAGRQPWAGKRSDGESVVPKTHECHRMLPSVIGKAEDAATTSATGCVAKLRQRSIALAFDAALASDRGRGKAAAAGTATGSDNGERSATARSVCDGHRICPSGAERPRWRHRMQDAGRHGRQRPQHSRLTTSRKTMGAVQWERERFCQERGENRNPPLLCLSRHPRRTSATCEVWRPA